MNENTLYYTLSAIPQILAATSAVLAAFVHFRLTTVHNILIGDGKATLDRIGETGYELDKGQKDRLRDGIYRKSISEIKEILTQLKNKERDDGYTKITRPTGLTYLFEDRFCPTEKHYSHLKNSSIVVIGFCLATIIFSVISLSRVDCIVAQKQQSIFLNINIILFTLSIIASFVLVFHSSTHKLIHESTKIRDKIIEKNKTHSIS